MWIDPARILIASLVPGMTALVPRAWQIESTYGGTRGASQCLEVRRGARRDPAPSGASGGEWDEDSPFTQRQPAHMGLHSEKP